MFSLKLACNVQCRLGADSFLRIRPSLISLDSTCVQSPPLFYSDGRAPIHRLFGLKHLCKLDGESVMAIIESSKNGCTVRKQNNFSIFLLGFSRKKVYTFYSCGNLIISKVLTEVNRTQLWAFCGFSCHPCTSMKLNNKVTND